MESSENEPLLFGVSCVPEGVESSSPRGDVTFVRQTYNPEGPQDTDGHNGDGEQDLELLRRNVGPHEVSKGDDL